MLYFAYGSNLDPTQMRQRCPSARFAALARLDDHRLAFTRASMRGGGVADVVPTNGEVVWGVLYEIDEPDCAELDRFEGYRAGRSGNAYERVTKLVTRCGAGSDAPVSALVYIANPQPNPPPPTSEYLSRIVAGARFWQLPTEYIELLERFGKSS